MTASLLLRNLGRALVSQGHAALNITATEVEIVAAPGAGLRLIVLDGEGSASAVGTVQWLAGASPLTGADATGIATVLRVPVIVLPEDTALIASVTGVGAAFRGWISYGTVRV